MIQLPSASLLAALVAAGLMGVRHGLDCDHIAALSDLVSIEKTIRRSIRLGLSYIAGHSLVIATLGTGAICLKLALPCSVDHWIQKVVGLTLIAFSAYVAFTLVRPHTHSHTHSPSRAALLISAVRWILVPFRGWRTGSTVSQTSASNQFGNHSSFVIGMIHGLGAETPTQLLLFLVAAKLGGVASGLLALAIFILGMGIMNTLLCVVMARVFLKATNSRRLQTLLSVMTAGYSFLVGTIMLGDR
jgi:cytochrome c biogenesis protein CcdA